MIKIENTEIVGWEAAIRGMRNPLNSWDKSDSAYELTNLHINNVSLISGGLVDTAMTAERGGYKVGNNDLDLMRRLVSAGTDHAKYRRMITVYMDITAPLYWWKEFDTYKVGTVANSCSTMHKIHDKEFTLDDFSCEHLNDDSLDILKNHLLKGLNAYREEYLICKDKQDWWQMIQLLPSSYNQRRTVQLNYEVLANMYKSRKAHKLDEWREFCKWIENLPYSELITGGN